MSTLSASNNDLATCYTFIDNYLQQYEKTVNINREKDKKFESDYKLWVDTNNAITQRINDKYKELKNDTQSVPCKNYGLSGCSNIPENTCSSMFGDDWINGKCKDCGLGSREIECKRSEQSISDYLEEFKLKLNDTFKSFFVKKPEREDEQYKHIKIEPMNEVITACRKTNVASFNALLDNNSNTTTNTPSHTPSKLAPNYFSLNAINSGSSEMQTNIIVISIFAFLIFMTCIIFMA